METQIVASIWFAYNWMSSGESFCKRNLLKIFTCKGKIIRLAHSIETFSGGRGQLRYRTLVKGVEWFGYITGPFLLGSLVYVTMFQSSLH